MQAVSYKIKNLGSAVEIILVDENGEDHFIDVDTDDFFRTLTDAGLEKTNSWPFVQ